ncbi:hypothetical protein OQA88_2107 [Cercophora sp. LCS_1]
MPKNPIPVQGRVRTYRLMANDLDKYLRSQFPGYDTWNFRVQLSADGKEFYTFETPKALTPKQLKYIDENVALRPPDEEPDFL